MPASSSSASVRRTKSIGRMKGDGRRTDVISREVNVKEAARLLRLIPGGGTGGIMWKLLMMAHKLNRTGSVVGSSLACSIECRKIIMQRRKKRREEGRDCCHTHRSSLM